MSSTLQRTKCIEPDQMATVVDRLFRRLIAFYGTKFADAYAGLPISEIRDIWAEELRGYSIAEIATGIEACRSLKWPPTLPEFLAACRPPIEAEGAYYEAVRNMALREHGQNPAYSHPAIYWASQEIGPWELRHTPAKLMVKVWSHVLRKHMAMGSWDPVPEPMKQLEAPKGHPPSPAVAERLRSLIEKLRSNTTVTPAGEAP